MIGMIAVYDGIQHFACSKFLNKLESSFKAVHTDKRIDALFIARGSVGFKL